MEQLDHIFRPTKCAWHTVGKLEEVNKKVQTAVASAALLLEQPEETGHSIEATKLLLEKYRTLDTAISEFQWSLRATSTMLMAIPIDVDYETMKSALSITMESAYTYFDDLVVRILASGLGIEIPSSPAPSVLTLQKSHYDMNAEILKREANIFLADLEDPAWIRAICTEKGLREVRCFGRRLIGALKEMSTTVRERIRNDKENILEATLSEVNKAQDKLKTIVECYKGNVEVNKVQQLADLLFYQFSKSWSVYRYQWSKFIFCNLTAIPQETFHREYVNLGDEQRKLCIAFDELCTNYPHGAGSSPRLDRLKMDMELMFRKVHVFYDFYQKSQSSVDKSSKVVPTRPRGPDRFVVYEQEFGAHADNVEKMIKNLQNSQTIRPEEIEEYRVFVDSEICFLKCFVLLEDYIAACPVSTTRKHEYRCLFHKMLKLRRTCEYLKYYMSVENTVYCNNPLWSKILSDMRMLVFGADVGGTWYRCGLLLPMEKLLPFVLENGMNRESDSSEDVMFRSLIDIKQPGNLVNAESCLNLLMRKLEESTSKEAAERAFYQLGLMGTFTKERLKSVFPADSPVLAHLLANLPKKIQEVSEKVLEPSSQISKVVSERNDNAVTMLKKSDATISMPAAKPTMKGAVGTAVIIKKEFNTVAASNIDNIASNNKSTDCNWYANIVGINAQSGVGTNSRQVTTNSTLRRPELQSTIRKEIVGINSNTGVNRSAQNGVGSVVNSTVRHGNTASGNGNIASGYGNFAPRHGNMAPGNSNIAPGHNNIASGSGNFASGHGNIASGSGNTTPKNPHLITIRDLVAALYMRPIAK